MSRRAPRRASRQASRTRTLAAVLVSGLLVVSCASAPECERIPGVRPGVCALPVAERAPVPEVLLPVLPSDAALAAGVTELSLADLQGRVVVVNFWASWCGPCRIEQPDLNAVDALLPDAEVVLVGVNIEDTEANALAHLAEFAVPYLSVFDPVNEVAGRFEGIGARTIPSTVFVDREGRVAARVLGLTDACEVAGLVSEVALG